MRRIFAGVALVVLGSILTSARDVHHLPWFLLTLLSAFVILAAWRPVAALATVATMLPVAQWCGRRWNGDIIWTDVLVFAFGLGYAGREVLRRETEDVPDPTLNAAAATMAAVVVASWVVDVWMGVALDTTTTAVGWLRSFRDYAVTGGFSAATDIALILLQGLFLFAMAGRCGRTSPAFRRVLPRCIAVAAAVAAALTVARLFDAARMHPDFWRVFVGHLASTRLNVHYGDVNAAGSFFVMTTFVVVALAWAASGYRRAAWMVAAFLNGVGLWVSGSRSAIVAGLVVLVLGVALAGSRRWLTGGRKVRANTAITVSALVAGFVLALFTYLPVRSNQAASLVALRIRLEFAGTSLRMAASRPFFGIGLAQYYPRSHEFSSPELLTLFPFQNENAHNNFLQILAELGLVGLASLLWILWLSARRLSALATQSPEPLAWGLIAGLSAFVITWLAGHPLLTREPAYAFFLLLGGASGWGTAVAPRKAAAGVNIASVIATVAIVLLVVTLPLHAKQHMAHANLEHIGIGVSPWQTADDGVRYRWCNAACSVFIPTDARAIYFVIRATPGHSSVLVALRLDGRLANEINVDSDRWTTVSVLVPHSTNTRFRPLDLVVMAGAVERDRPIIMVGKVQTR